MKTNKSATDLMLDCRERGVITDLTIMLFPRDTNPDEQFICQLHADDDTIWTGRGRTPKKAIRQAMKLAGFDVADKNAHG